jgi:hypothetical protein
MTDRIEEASSPEEWNNILGRSHHATPFHLAECLQTCAEYTGTSCHLYIGYKGQEPTGVFPIFELQKGPFTAVFSPPPNLKIPYLGPAVVMPDGMKRRKCERWTRSFVDAVVEHIETELRPQYSQVRTSPKVTDERPFLWNDYSETLRHTYVVTLPDSDQDIEGSFSSDARRNTTADHPGELIEGDVESVERILGTVTARHADQDIAFGLDPSFVRALYDRLPDDCMRTYVYQHDGRFLGGDILFEYDDTVYGWLGAGDLSVDIPVNDILYGSLLRDAHQRGFERYDMIGADNPRLSSYKAKFGPDLESYTSLVRCGVTGQMAARLYKQIQKR